MSINNKCPFLWIGNLYRRKSEVFSDRFIPWNEKYRQCFVLCGRLYQTQNKIYASRDSKKASHNIVSYVLLYIYPSWQTWLRQSNYYPTQFLMGQDFIFSRNVPLFCKSQILGKCKTFMKTAEKISIHLALTA